MNDIGTSGGCACLCGGMIGDGRKRTGLVMGTCCTGLVAGEETGIKLTGSMR